MTIEKTRSIYVVGPDKYVADWMQGEITANIVKADIVVFTGGPDVDPAFYNEPVKHSKTVTLIERDAADEKAFRVAKYLHKPCVGIARGAQFLCAMSGGKLIQHQDSPLVLHDIDTFDNMKIEVTSFHHQAMWPYSIPTKDYEILAWTKGISQIHQDGFGGELPLPGKKECEIIHFKTSDCLAIQAHPERIYKSAKHKPTMAYLQNLLTKFIEKRIY